VQQWGWRRGPGPAASANDSPLDVRDYLAGSLGSWWIARLRPADALSRVARPVPAGPSTDRIRPVDTLTGRAKLYAWCSRAVRAPDDDPCTEVLDASEVVLIANSSAVHGRHHPVRDIGRNCLAAGMSGGSIHAVGQAPVRGLRSVGRLARPRCARRSRWRLACRWFPARPPG
jgi:hypothetical protein